MKSSRRVAPRTSARTACAQRAKPAQSLSSSGCVSVATARSAGVATAVKHHCPRTDIFTVEPKDFDDTARSIASQSRQSNTAGGNSFCDALLAPEPGQLTFQVNQRLCSSGLAVSDDEVAAAMAAAFGQLKLVVEPGGAVALAAALAGKLDLSNGNTVIVLSGGNVDPALFAEVLAGN